MLLETHPVTWAKTIRLIGITPLREKGGGGREPRTDSAYL